MVRSFYIFAITILLFVSPTFVDAANLSIAPASETIEVGDRVTVRVMVSGSESINAISGELSVPTSMFSIESVSKFGSILNFWVAEPSFSNVSGRVSFEGVALGGFQGGSGSVVTVSLRAKSVGSGKINFTSGQVLANDGQGTNVTQNLLNGTFTIIESTKKEEPKEVIEEPEIVVAPATLKSPEIVLVSKYGEKAISGNSSYLTSQVVVTFINDEGVRVFVQGETDLTGQFLVLVPKTLKRGYYKVSAQVVEKDLSYSPSSNVIKIKVGNIVSDLGWNLMIAIVLLIVALIYLIIRSYMHFKKERVIKTEAREAKEILKKSFKLLHEDVSSKQSPKDIIKDLEDAEDLISKELKDIEKL